MAIRRMMAMVAVVSVACLGGCAIQSRKPTYKGSAFHRIIVAETRPQGLGATMTEKEVQAEVDRLLALRPAAAAPSNVLLFEVESSGVSNIASPTKLLTLRKETSEAMKAALEETGLFQGIDFLPDVYLPADRPADLKTLRIAAARAHADALLIYSTEAGYEERVNALGVFYPTIVGAFVVPASRGSSIAVSKAVLVDVRTGYIYRVLEAYGEESSLAPTALLNEEELEFKARKQALGALAKLAADKVKKLAAAKK
ncbi:MAG: hypothetical protein ABIF82_10970 [Planctomycetota bacterium]